MEFKSITWLVGTAIGVLGVVAPVVWDSYKSKLELEVRVADRSTLIGPAAKIDGLTITYKGENLEQLAQTSITITNTGRTPILDRDVVSPLTITFDKAAQVVDARINGTIPADLAAKANYSRDKNEVIVTVPLLNSGDLVKLNVLTKTEKIDFGVQARIAGLNSIVVDKSGLSTSSTRSSRWVAICVGIFSAPLVLISLVGLHQAKRERRAKQALRNDELIIPVLSTKAETILWIDKRFDFASSKERNAAKQRLNQLEDVENFSVAHDVILMDEIRSLLENMMPNFLLAAALISLSGWGFWYSVTNLFYG